VGITDLAKNLALRTIVLVKVDGRGIAAGTGTLFRDVAFLPPLHRFEIIAVALLVVVNEVLPVPVLGIRLDLREFIHLVLLVLWGMGIVISPLFERDIPADKCKKPRNLLI